MRLRGRFVVEGASRPAVESFALAATAQIRQEIIAMKNLSVKARKVNIINGEGRVRRRGPVNTAAEKFLLKENAQHSRHSRNVDNQLEVKSTTNLSD